MPYQSDAQRAYMHIHHQDIAARWDREYGGEVKRYHNSRNFDGDTHDTFEVDSEMPWVSPDPVDSDGNAMMPNAGGDYDMISTPMGSWVDADGGVHTRFKPGPSTNGGDISIDGGGV